MSGVGAFLVALLVCLLIVDFLKVLQSRRCYPPGSLPLPLIGSLWQALTGINQHSLIKQANKYGNICTVWIGNKPLVLLSGFHTVKEVLINHSKDFSDRPVSTFFDTAKEFKGILFSNGQTWKQQRRFGQVTMRKLGLGKKGLEPHIEEQAQQLVETLAHAKGKPLDPKVPITNSVCNVICVLLYGHLFSTEDKEFQELMEGLDAENKFLTSPTFAIYEIVPWCKKYLPKVHRKTMSEFKIKEMFARKQVEQHKEYLSFHEPQDFIDFYLLQMEKSKDDPNTTYDEDNLAVSMADLFTAGIETTAATLQWALLLMATHPDIQDRVHKEMEDVFRPFHLICYQDRRKLPYINAVIHEIQRAKYALFFGLPRQCKTDVNVLGYIIPKGTVILPDLRSVLLDPKQWETPEEFNPNHFLDKEGRFVDREEFLPFGAGARVCLGKQLAQMEVFIFFTRLLRAFKFQLPEGVKEVNQEPALGLITPPHPYKLCCIPHCSASSTT